MFFSGEPDEHLKRQCPKMSGAETNHSSNTLWHWTAKGKKREQCGAMMSNVSNKADTEGPPGGASEIPARPGTSCPRTLSAGGQRSRCQRSRCQRQRPKGPR